MDVEFPNLSNAKQIVLDVETSGLDWKRDRPVGYVVTWGPKPDETRYFPTDHTGGGNIDGRNACLEWLATHLRRNDLTVIGHNLKFDLHFAHNDGLTVSAPVGCTQINAALIDENIGAYSLDAVSKRCNVQVKKGNNLYIEMANRFGGKPDRSQMANFHRMPGDHPLVKEYAEGDGTTTWQVQDVQHSIMERENLQKVWQVESQVLPVLYKMERRGVRIDEEKLHWLKKEIEARLARAEQSLPKGFNPRSGIEIREYLKARGVESFPRTLPTTRFPEGQDSFTGPWLATIPQGAPILAVRKLSNLLNTFIDPLIEQHLFKGRVHCSFNQLAADDYGTRTGRLSSSGPNMQQNPKRDKELAPLFRQVFLPEEGHQWSANDYSQQEFRVFADYTGSSLLLRGYKAVPPLDIHTVVAQLLSVDRDPAKTMNFGILYGMGTGKLARSLSISEANAKSLRAQYDEMIPEVRRFTKQAESVAITRGYVRTKLGRRRRFPDKSKAYKAGNAVIQGSSADMTKVKMVEIDKLFEGHASALMLQVHDELDWTVAPGEEHLTKQAQEIMCSFGPEDVIHFNVPFTVDSHLASDWARASFPDWGSNGQ